MSCSLAVLSSLWSSSARKFSNAVEIDFCLSKFSSALHSLQLSCSFISLLICVAARIRLPYCSLSFCCCCCSTIIESSYNIYEINKVQPLNVCMRGKEIKKKENCVIKVFSCERNWMLTKRVLPFFSKIYHRFSDFMWLFYDFDLPSFCIIIFAWMTIEETSDVNDKRGKLGFWRKCMSVCVWELRLSARI